jgi:hypothetical protein
MKDQVGQAHVLVVRESSIFSFRQTRRRWPTGDEPMPQTITVLHVPGCAGGAAALAIASKIADARADVSVSDVVIEDDATAVALGFRGSPTLLVDGREVEPDSQTPIGTMG